MSKRRKRLHDLLLTLINKDSEFEFIEEDSSDLTSSYSEKDTLNLSRVIEKNRKIIKRYQAIVRTAVTLDALMDSEMKKITKSNKNIFLKKILPLLLLLSFIFNPLKVSAEVAETEINGEFMNASSEFLRDLDFETWQLVAYNQIFEDKLILRVIGYPEILGIDHPTDLRVESGRKQWLLDDKTLLNVELANDGRQAAAEFDLDELIKNLDKNRPLRLSLSGVFSELPVPPFVVKEWRSIN